ncbi:sodium:proton antiporter [Aeromonas salmonicida]|uniref:sodium:proton antiporter NhaD n=1 Tax=Aeromonas salmonicida TaxID=645 RepID=UPI000F7ADDC0|nr:sodium:proton antiporter NhaD [Aeromonas salmonicida]RSM28484.1 sodium:proton antiporter [Aeromonas salmonicida]
MSVLTRFAVLLSLFISPAQASSGPIPLTLSTIGLFCMGLFVLAYALVMAEEYLQLRKSKPVLVAAGVIWILIGIAYAQNGMSPAAEQAFRHTLLEYAELMLFLLVAMTYINAMEDRNLFDALRAWLIRSGFQLRTLFWLTGGLAFCISPVADNLTTALLMCAVVLKVANGDRRFINLACINIVIAANAGGAFSPFGDITTLMVWQAGKVQFGQFFALFIPSLLNFLVPALLMSLMVPRHVPDAASEDVDLKRGARRIVLLFLLTITTAVLCHSFLHLPPVLGMMLGLGYLQFFGFYLRKSLPHSLARKRALYERTGDHERLRRLGSIVPFDVFNKVAKAEWDTLLFFYGVVMCVGGLGFMGYLELVSHLLYDGGNPTMANIFIGLLSSVIDNIPVMFAVLSMNPDMALGQWLLVTLTAGVGGSLLSIGSAAGVALMGQAHGMYTFFSHLKWLPAILLGYLVSIGAHLWLNSAMF